MAEVWKKLLLHKAERALALNTPGGDYAALVGGLPEGFAAVDLEQRGENGSYDFVHLFVTSIDELNEKAPLALAALADSGILWCSYPKKSSKVSTDISRDKGWKVLRDAGFEAVTQVSVDDTWSALRFRPSADIPTLTRKFKND